MGRGIVTPTLIVPVMAARRVVITQGATPRGRAWEPPRFLARLQLPEIGRAVCREVVVLVIIALLSVATVLVSGTAAIFASEAVSITPAVRDAQRGIVIVGVVVASVLLFATRALVTGERVVFLIALRMSMASHSLSPGWAAEAACCFLIAQRSLYACGTT